MQETTVTKTASGMEPCKLEDVRMIIPATNAYTVDEDGNSQMGDPVETVEDVDAAAYYECSGQACGEGSYSWDHIKEHLAEQA